MLVSYRTTRDPAEIAAAYRLVHDLTDSYPGFDAWWRDKAAPDVVRGQGIMLLAEQDSQIVGVALGKTGEEVKLRCLRVVPGWRGQGIGLGLTERMLALLGSDRPLVTVPQDMIHAYARPFVNTFHFALSRVEKGLYRKGKLEYVFNGA